MRTVGFFRIVPYAPRIALRNAAYSIYAHVPSGAPALFGVRRCAFHQGFNAGLGGLGAYLHRISTRLYTRFIPFQQATARRQSFSQSHSPPQTRYGGACGLRPAREDAPPWLARLALRHELEPRFAQAGLRDSGRPAHRARPVFFVGAASIDEGGKSVWRIRRRVSGCSA